MRMRRSVLILLLFLLFIVQGTIVPWLLPDVWEMRVIPNLVFIVILFVTVYHHRHTALILGLSFGMLHDVVFYGRILGAHSFAMGLSAYLIGLVFQLPRAPLPLMMTVVLLGSLLEDSILFGIYSVFNLNREPYNWSLLNHMLPTMLFHFAVGLLLYIPVRRQLELLKKETQKEESA
ncbi:MULTISPECIES: rod shape-determining protein MreD [unclassified Paenibacillus]|uniref:rod shape-determining protein MreD n=1 Tax=unclassified Paenibacillus TaxID=185978 RepID=UPI0024076E0C|nr:MULTISPECIES: rod shape-determining protein MreD [unclassified Paenibacillus]MDF9844004.1 rod shape-determining protein MreD [Paenibacillus sp. PastF-2]MDF9850609.1 rod shape-determining protein MreD [Paenibacillus sp. PastM-2]MDF9857241.1 rod shape-determining protein MreD [Paenibacillus sp. PastF-1]MDH6482459.1 rod shape-determining protein MreD [Paenibacillus sp. PastH-2]MDH6509938.1 rod shape-determining protein MreD [Paenibacillus sp. PastM-3]